MKKLLLLSIVTLLSFTSAFSQEKGSVELGGNLGVNFAVANANNNSTNSLTAFNVGAVGEYYFNDEWGIKAKIIYDQKGWADGFVSLPDGSTVTSDFNLNYVTIPVMANWHFGSTKKWYLNFGLYAGFLLDAKAANLDLTESFEGVDFGLATGIGYKFPIDENTKLFIELEGQGGFNGVFKEGITAKNSRTALNFGVLFDLK